MIVILRWKFRVSPVLFPSSKLFLSSYKYKKTNTGPVKTLVFKKVNYQDALQKYFSRKIRKIMVLKGL